MAEQNLKEGTWDPSRVLDALGRIGYNPVAAILDIVDNSVSAKAANIHVELRLESDSRNGKGRKRTTLAAVSIIDDGIGMSPEGLHNAIALGSSDGKLCRKHAVKIRNGVEGSVYVAGSSLHDCFQAGRLRRERGNS